MNRSCQKTQKIKAALFLSYKMDIKTVLFVFLIICVLFTSSCGLINFGGGQNANVAITQESLRTGTDALSMEFYKDFPPNATYENTEFEVALVIRNKGASDITDGIIILSYEDFLIENTEKSWLLYNTADSSLGTGNAMNLEVKGRTLETPDGEEKVFSKTLKTKQVEKLKEMSDASISATACYDYKTVKGVPICVDPLKFQKIDKPCEMKTVSLSSQGGPLAITKVVPRLVNTEGKQEFEVDIYFQDKGKGTIFQKGKAAIACGRGTQSTSLLKVINEQDVTVRFGSESGKTFKCSPFPLELTGKDDFIKCLYMGSITEDQAYSTLLYVEFNYGYMHGINTDMKIIRRNALK